MGRIGASTVLVMTLGCVPQATQPRPPPAPLHLGVSPLVAGETVEIQVSNAPSFAPIYLAFNQRGLGQGDCPPVLAGDCLELVPPAFPLPLSGQADILGEASWTVTLPASMSGVYVGLQAAAGTPLALSNAVAMQVAPPGSSRLGSVDADGDGFSPEEGDCDDNNPRVSPVAPDVLGDGYDADCSGTDGTDRDGDGVHSPSAGGLDCDDADPARYPGAAETCDRIDNDCDGIVDTPGAPCSVVDVFVVGAAQPVDLLFVVDSSDSMLDAQLRLASVVPQLFETVHQAEIALHIGVVTMDTHGGDAGELQGAYGAAWFDGAHGSPEDAADWFALAGVPGDGGARQERGLRAAALSLSPAMQAGPNQGFYRTDADLHVVFLTDAEDESGGNPEVADFALGLGALKTGRYDAQSHGLVGPAGGCVNAESGSRYRAAIYATGGVEGSICDVDWSAFGAELTGQILETAGGGRGPVTLSDVPAAAQTIDVVALVPSGGAVPLSPQEWVYDAQRNTIDVVGRAFPVGTALVVTYGI